MLFTTVTATLQPPALKHSGHSKYRGEKGAALYGGRHLVTRDYFWHARGPGWILVVEGNGTSLPWGYFLTLVK